MPDGKVMNAFFEPSMYDMSFDAKIDGRNYNAVMMREGRALVLLHHGQEAHLTYLDPLSYDAEEDTGHGKLTAPMPGKVVAVRVTLGAAVKKGQPLVIVEAMKMEHTITAPVDGVVDKIHAKVVDQVNEKYELISLKTA